MAGRRVLGGGDDVVELSGKEAALLEVLARRPTKVFTRPELLAAVFDPEDGQGTVDTYVYYLRRKLGRDVRPHRARPRLPAGGRMKTRTRGTDEDLVRSAARRIAWQIRHRQCVDRRHRGRPGVGAATDSAWRSCRAL